MLNSNTTYLGHGPSSRLYPGATVQTPLGGINGSVQIKRQAKDLPRICVITRVDTTMLVIIPAFSLIGLFSHTQEVKRAVSVLLKAYLN